jgi:hypothetical protein
MRRPLAAEALKASLNAAASKDSETTSALSTNAAKPASESPRRKILRLKPKKEYSGRQAVGKPSKQDGLKRSRLLLVSWSRRCPVSRWGAILPAAQRRREW